MTAEAATHFTIRFPTVAAGAEPASARADKAPWQLAGAKHLMAALVHT
jgi:hypothetical protein